MVVTVTVTMQKNETEHKLFLPHIFSSYTVFVCQFEYRYTYICLFVHEIQGQMKDTEFIDSKNRILNSKTIMYIN